VSESAAREPREPITLASDAEEIVLGCTACGREVRVAMEPTLILLRTIDDFVRKHAPCQVVA
jgi:hypothetical protein